MLNRRRFFQSLGAAVLGTALILKIPEELIPQVPEIEADCNYRCRPSLIHNNDCDYLILHGRILAELHLQIATPRMNSTIYIENC